MSDHEAIEEPSIRELFSALLDQSVAGVFLLQDGLIRYVNAAYARMRADTTPERMIGLPVGDDLEPDHRRELQHMYDRRLAGLAPHDRFTITRTRANGSPRHIEIHGVQVTYRGRPAIMGVGIDVTEQIRARAALERVQDDERRRIALEIHDELGGALAAARLDLARLERRLADADLSDLPHDADHPGTGESLRAALREDARHVSTTLRSAVESVRNLSQDLRPVALERLGLFGAIEDLAESFARRRGIECTAAVPDLLSSVHADAALDLYRIVQESLTNIAKHAGAHRAAVRLVRVQDLLPGTGAAADHLEVTVDDDGTGPGSPARAPGTGLTGMRERAARLGGLLRVEDSPLGGTRIAVRVPWTFSEGVNP